MAEQQPAEQATSRRRYRMFLTPKGANMPIKRSLAARVGIDILRKKYRAPKPAWNSGRSQSDYCVGGALCGELCVELGYPIADPPLFPSEDLLAEAMCVCNNNLPKRQALVFAREVSQKNDRGFFEDAWAALEEALSYG